MNRQRYAKLKAIVGVSLLVGCGLALTVTDSAAAPRHRPPAQAVVHRRAVRRRALRRAFPHRPARPVIVRRPRPLVVRRLPSGVVIVRGKKIYRKFPEPVVVSTAQDLEAVPTPDLDECLGYRVIDVNDDCTIRVDMDGERTTVRLIGVETQVVGPDGQALTDRALEHLRRLVSGEFVYLEFDADYVQEDEDGNQMAYVRRAPDGLFVNVELLRQGSAVADSDYVYRYQDVFSFYEAKAQADGRGLWGRTDAQDASDQPASEAQPTTREAAMP